VSTETINLPHSILSLKDTGAVAFLLLLYSKPTGATVSKSEVTDQFKIGRTAFYRARKLLIDLNLIEEIKKNNRQGHFDGIEYRLLVSHETALPKSEHGSSPFAEKINVAELTRSMILKNESRSLNNSCSLNESKNNVRDKGFERNQIYSIDFDRLWNSFSEKYGKKGSKQEAFKQFEKLNIGPDDTIWLINELKQEMQRKAAIRSAGGFAENFPHVCRFLKNRLWEEWADSPTSLVDEIII